MYKWFKGKRSLDLKSFGYEQSLGSRVVCVGFQADICHLTRFLERKITFTQGIELFHMASRPPCCKGRPFCCLKQVLWELNSYYVIAFFGSNKLA